VKVLISLKGGRVYESFCNRYHFRCFIFSDCGFVERANFWTRVGFPHPSPKIIEIQIFVAEEPLYAKEEINLILSE
jgi:hypothetical protein